MSTGKFGNDGTGSIGDFYVNPQYVTFTWFSDEAVNITHYHPGEFDEEKADLEYCLILESHQQLKEVLGIDMTDENKAPGQVNSINLEHLIDLYHRGIASIECSIENGDDYYSLYFYKTAYGDMTVWSDEKANDEQALPQEFTRPEEFINYTMQRLAALNIK